MSHLPAETLRLFLAARNGDGSAVDKFSAALYDELHRLAVAYMHGERSDHTLQATALVNEAYLRLVDRQGLDSLARADFLALAAKSMRRVLLDHARSKRRDKRGGQRERVTLSDSIALLETSAVDVLDLEDALELLARLEPRHGKIVELRFYGGLTNEELTAVLDVSLSTVEKDWRWARAWLLERLGTKA